MGTPSQVKEELIEKYNGKKAIIIFASEEPVETLKQRGFHRAWVNGEVVELSALSSQLDELS